MSAVDCPSSFNLMGLKYIYKFFTVQGYPPGSQILMQILPYNYLRATKADAAIQTTVYKYVNKTLIEPLEKIHFSWLFQDILRTLGDVKDFARYELTALITKKLLSMKLQVGLKMVTNLKLLTEWLKSYSKKNMETIKVIYELLWVFFDRNPCEL
eukprot:13241607-Ditylum_brightwellii.AAC.1